MRIGSRVIYTPSWGAELFAKVLGPGRDDQHLLIEPEPVRPNGSKVENRTPFHAPIRTLRDQEGLW